MNFRKLFGLCVHTWVEVAYGNLLRVDPHSHRYGVVGKYWIYKCDKCHKVKEVRS